MREVATLDAAPELLLCGEKEMLVERISCNGHFNPFAAAGDDGEHRRAGLDHPHVVLKLGHVFLGRSFFRERPWQHEFGFEDGSRALDPYGYNGQGVFEMKKGSLSSAQIWAARALLRWSAADLARDAALGANTIRRAEVAEEETSLTTANELAIRRTLEAAGVEFIEENGSGRGVHLRKPAKEKFRK
jgi:hypothetical protein